MERSAAGSGKISPSVVGGRSADGSADRPVLLLRFEHGFPGGYADRFRSWFHGCRFRILDSAFPQA